MDASGQIALLGRETRVLDEGKQRSPVSRLHPDVLLSVFFALRDLVMDKREKVWYFLVITHVCSVWRNVALECPVLWARIESFPPNTWKLDIMRAFLGRSEQTELKAVVFIPERKATSISSLLSDHMWRIREFRIDGYDKGLESMESCFLKMTHRTKVLDIRYVWTDINSFPTLSKNYPNIQLESLRLSCVAIPWTSSLIRGLSSLKLGIIRGWRGEAPTLYEFINLLKFCPNLRSIWIRSVSLYYRDSDCAMLEMESRGLKLPHLKNVSLHGFDISNCTFILQLMNVTEITRLDLQLGDYRPHSTTRLDPVIYNLLMQKECQVISVYLTFHNTTIRASSARVETQDRDRVSHNLSIQTHESWYSMPELSIRSMLVFLEDPFWRTAREVVITFGKDEGYGFTYSWSKAIWNIFIKDLSDHTRQLTVKFSSKYRQHCESIIGLLDAISAPHYNDESEIEVGDKPQFLEEITIHCSEFSAADIEDRHRAILEQSDDSRMCKVRFLDYEEPRKRDARLIELLD